MSKVAAAEVTRILGIDPGTRLVGYALLDQCSPVRIDYIECGVIRSPVGEPMAVRLHHIAAMLEEIVVELRPDAIAVEKAYHGRNAASALKLGQARGAIMVVGARHCLPVFEYAPARVKRAVVGHGRASKAEVQNRVRLLCNLEKVPVVDAADALAIALCHAYVGTGEPA